MKVDLICKECGNKEDGSWADDCANQLIKEQLCFHCDFWYEKIEIKDSPKVARIEGVHYYIGDEKQEGFRGFDSSRFIIQFNDGREIITTNLWCQGKIPDRFKEKLSDNAVFKRV